MCAVHNGVGHVDLILIEDLKCWELILFALALATLLKLVAAADDVDSAGFLSSVWLGRMNLLLDLSLVLLSDLFGS